MQQQPPYPSHSNGVPAGGLPAPNSYSPRQSHPSSSQNRPGGAVTPQSSAQAAMLVQQQQQMLHRQTQSRQQLVGTGGTSGAPVGQGIGVNPAAMAAFQQQYQQPQLYQQQQQQQQQQLQQRGGGGGTAAPAAQSNPQKRSEIIQMSDANEGYRNAKRRKPTDRSLPTFLPSSSSLTASLSTTLDTVPTPTEVRLAPSTAALQSLSTSYSKLQEVERKLDWTLSRRKVEMFESTEKSRIPGVARKLRIHLTTTLLDQPWQLPVADIVPPPKIDPSTNEADLAVDPSLAPRSPSSFTLPTAAPVGAVDFSKGTGVPRWELAIAGEIVLLPEEAHVAKNFTAYVLRIVVETDRDATLYDGPSVIDWNRPLLPTAGVVGLTLSLPASTATELKISFYLDHRPERLSLHPTLANLLGISQTDRLSAVQMLWNYIKLNGLQESDKRHIKVDAKMKDICPGQDRIPFHHLPEYVNRWLLPPAPAVIQHTIQVDDSAGAVSRVAYEVDVGIEDPVSAKIKQTSAALSNASKEIGEIIALDDQIAASASLIKLHAHRRSLLAAFASSPLPVLQTFVSSQSASLATILGSDRATQSNAIGGGAAWREEVRRGDVWRGGWVEEGANVYGVRHQEAAKKALMEKASAAARRDGSSIPLDHHHQQQQQQQQQQFGRR